MSLDWLTPISVTGQLQGNGNIPTTGQMVAMGSNVPMSTAQLMTGAGQQGGGFMNSLSNAWNNNPLGVIGQGVSAFNTLAQIYSSFKALDLAEDQFSFQKKAWNKNYNNQVKDYENQLKSRWAARDSAAKARGQEFESMSSWVGDRRLTGT